MISDRLEKPLASWRGKERYENELLECLTVIFKSGGCTWSDCRMCSYRHERYQAESCDALLDHLKAQLAWVMNEYNPEEYRMVKILLQEVFLIPVKFPRHFFPMLPSAFRGKLVIAETRPEFVREEVLAPFIETLDDGSWKTPLYCAIGLETSNDTIREKCINKGFTFQDFTGCCQRAHAAGAGVKAYLLFKPLFLTEREAVEDMKTSIADTVPLCRYDLHEPLHGPAEHRAGVLLEAGSIPATLSLERAHPLTDAPVHVTCDPLGGGQKRGPHNCGKCDYEIVKGIRDYSLNGDRDLIGALLDIACGCKEEWEFVLSEEKPYCMPLTR